MVHETIADLQGEVHRWCRALAISQNEYARRCGVHPSILSRVLKGTVRSEPATAKMRAFNGKLQRRLEKVS
mgnify:CR=1 FL=1